MTTDVEVAAEIILGKDDLSSLTEREMKKVVEAVRQANDDVEIWGIYTTERFK